MGSSANFAATPRCAIVDVSTANTNRDGTGTIEAGPTAGAGGSRIERLEIKAIGTTTLGMVRAFKRQGAGAWKLWREYPVAAITPGAGVATYSTLDDEIAEILESGYQLGFATHNAEAFAVHVGLGDF